MTPEGGGTRIPDGLRRFLIANSGFTFAMGIQHVMFSWLLAGPLAQTPERIGLAQAALMASGVAFILFGGLVAERVDGRRMLPVLHALAALPPLAVAWSVASGSLRYEQMLGYALAVGIAGAFIAPARDALLNRVSEGAIPRAVALQLTAMWVGQLLGFVLAGSAERIGAASVLCVQAAALLAAAVAYTRVRPKHAHAGERGGSGLYEVFDAVREALRSPRLRAPLAMQFAIGLLLAGTWTVTTQLLVRDVYGGGATETSLAFGAMMIGTMAGTAAVALRGGVRRQGRLLVVAFVASGITTAVLSLAPTLRVALPIIVVWGAWNGLAVTMTRTIAQESAPASHRARVLSIFQLAILIGAPLGSWAMGLAIGSQGAARALWLPSAGLFGAGAVAALASGLPRIEALPVAPAPARPT